jgi:radical SAM protein with 4Fe4S-binding SPASM domain
MKRSKGTMTMELHKKIIDEAQNISIITLITITGLGEPLLDHDLLKKVKYIRKKIKLIPIEIYTNGAMLDRSMAQNLDRAGVTKLYVSLNAVNQLKHTQVMGIKNRFEKLKEVIEHSQKHLDMQIVVKAVASKDLMEGQEKEEFLKTWGDDAFLHMEGNWAGYLGKMRTTPTECCFRALHQIMVLWDGRVSLCCFDGEGDVIFGDLNRQSLKEIFAGEKASEYRRAHMEGRRSEMKLCKDCTSI